ncbi:MAG: chemotaxis protein CheW [Proteobacteria bacterium]|nr:chemotaxis protein CheW [Pseudomonadota bacterium]
MNKKNNISLLQCWKQIGVFGDFSCPKLVDIVHCRNCDEYNKTGRTLFDREVSEEFLEEWTKNLTGIKETEALDTISVIIMRIKNEWLALKTIFLQETTNLRVLHHVPFKTNNVFKGIVNINGELLLCISLADLLEYTLEEEKGEDNTAVYKRMVVINKDGERYVFPVDEVLGIYRIPSSDLKEPPVTLSKSPMTLVEGIFNLNEKKVGLLGEDKLIHALKRSLGN